MNTRLRIPLVETILAAGVILAATVLTATLAHGSAASAVTADSGVLPPADAGTFATILGRNAAVALGLFSGAVTLGISTGVFLLLVGAMLGWSMAISAAAIGVGETVLRCWAYTPLELAGFVLAGAAGLVPVLALVRTDASTLPRPVGAGPSLPRALRTFGVALLVLILAAAVETLSIALTTQRLNLA